MELERSVLPVLPPEPARSTVSLAGPQGSPGRPRTPRAALSKVLLACRHFCWLAVSFPSEAPLLFIPGESCLREEPLTAASAGDREPFMVPLLSRQWGSSPCGT